MFHYPLFLVFLGISFIWFFLIFSIFFIFFSKKKTAFLLKKSNNENNYKKKKDNNNHQTEILKMKWDKKKNKLNNAKYSRDVSPWIGCYYLVQYYRLYITCILCVMISPICCYFLCINHRRWNTNNFQATACFVVHQ